MNADLTEDELQQLYMWVDQFDLSRLKRNIARDFADGVLMAEIAKFFHPKLVELHNYSAANGLTQKMYNWDTLNRKVFKRIKFHVSAELIGQICNCVPGAVERLLRAFQLFVKRHPNMSASLSSDGDSTPARAAPAVTSGKPSGAAAAAAAASSAPAAAPRGARARVDGAALQKQVDTELLVEKEQTIRDLNETIDILETKIRKLEQLVLLKEGRIQTLQAKLKQVQDAS